jgi:branched-chain amino acid transport system ATP-binding protein
VAPFLWAEDVWASYGGHRAVSGVSIAVPEGSLVALLGPNGAGKSTLLKVLAGLKRPDRGRVMIDGSDVTRLNAHERARRGVLMVPEGRAIFPSLSVEDNLRLAGAPEGGLDRALRTFPVLRDRRRQEAGTLSGGEQQMLALARCLAVQSRVVLLDEPSLALAPRLVEEVFASIRRLKDGGSTVVLVEQYVSRALELADLAYVMRKGRCSFAGEPAELAGVGGAPLTGAYLGTETAGGPAR